MSKQYKRDRIVVNINWSAFTLKPRCSSIFRSEIKKKSSSQPAFICDRIHPDAEEATIKIESIAHNARKACLKHKLVACVCLPERQNNKQCRAGRQFTVWFVATSLKLTNPQSRTQSNCFSLLVKP